VVSLAILMRFGFITISERDSIVGENCPDSFSDTIESNGESKNAFTGHVARDISLDWDRHS